MSDPEYVRYVRSFGRRREGSMRVASGREGLARHAGQSAERGPESGVLGALFEEHADDERGLPRGVEVHEMHLHWVTPAVERVLGGRVEVELGKRVRDAVGASRCPPRRHRTVRCGRCSSREAGRRRRRTKGPGDRGQSPTCFRARRATGSYPRYRRLRPEGCPTPRDQRSRPSSRRPSAFRARRGRARREPPLVSVLARRYNPREWRRRRKRLRGPRTRTCASSRDPPRRGGRPAYLNARAPLRG